MTFVISCDLLFLVTFVTLGLIFESSMANECRIKGNPEAQRGINRMAGGSDVWVIWIVRTSD